MTRYYCSGFDINNAFGHGLGDMFLSELKDTKSINPLSFILSVRLIVRRRNTPKVNSVQIY